MLLRFNLVSSRDLSVSRAHDLDVFSLGTFLGAAALFEHVLHHGRPKWSQASDSGSLARSPSSSCLGLPRAWIWIQGLSLYQLSTAISGERLCSGSFPARPFSMPSMYSKKNIVQYGNLAKRMYSKAEKTCSWILRMRLKIWVLVCSGFHNYIPQTGWVKPQKSTPHRSGGWKSKIKVLAGLVSSVASMLARGHLLLCLHMVSLCVCVLIFSSYDDTSHIR